MNVYHNLIGLFVGGNLRTRSTLIRLRDHSISRNRNSSLRHRVWQVCFQLHPTDI